MLELSLEALHARLSDLETREAIRQLLTRYGIAADSGDSEGWANCWAEDATYERDGHLVATGRAAFHDALEACEGVHKSEIEGPGSVHAVGPLNIVVDGDDARVRGYAVVLVVSAGGYRVYSLSHNNWQLRRAGREWEIVSRVSRTVGPGAAAAVYRARIA